MADVNLNYTIPEEKVSTAMDGYLKLYPNAEKENPEEPESPLKYTDAQWVKESVRRIIVRDVRRGLQMIANESATVETDDGLVQ